MQGYVGFVEVTVNFRCVKGIALVAEIFHLYIPFHARKNMYIHVFKHTHSFVCVCEFVSACACVSSCVHNTYWNMIYLFVKVYIC